MAGRSDGAGGIAATGVARSTARGIVLAGVAVLGVLLWGGYVRHWAWTGFGDNDTLWDWLELALLPTAVATLPLWLRHRPLVHRRGRIGLAAACATFALLVLAGYLVPLRWTGFRGNTSGTGSTSSSFRWSWSSSARGPTSPPASASIRAGICSP